jgi:5-methyltetrahydropteroyltriglutamate--homocysteine methyltransferase
MRRSADRILTSHVGSLPRPDALRALFARQPSDTELAPALSAAVADVVAKQKEVGLDLVNDGEFGKPSTEEIDFGAWAFYAFPRIAGYQIVEFEIGPGILTGKDHTDFADFYARYGKVTSSGKIRHGVAKEPLRYAGHDQVARDIKNLKAALGGATDGAFMTAMSAGWASTGWGGPSIYATREEEAVALAEAMREEYRAIAAAGLTVQVDDPFLVNIYEFEHSVAGDLKAFRVWAERHVEVVNHSLAGIPEEQVRYHICWGSWVGPHSSDLPIKEVLDLILKIKAGIYSFEAGNVQHEHEWKAWRDVKLPDGKMVMPGVVSHKTDVLEHPELVADRIVQYADVVGRENVIAGVDCGLGGRIHPQLAWAKLKALSEGARRASERLWA